MAKEPTSMDRLRDLTKRVLAVPKAEIDQAAEKFKRRKRKALRHAKA